MTSFGRNLSTPSQRAVGFDVALPGGQPPLNRGGWPPEELAPA